MANTPQKQKNLVWFSCRKGLATKTLKPAFFAFVCLFQHGWSQQISSPGSFQTHWHEMHFKMHLQYLSPFKKLQVPLMDFDIKLPHDISRRMTHKYVTEKNDPGRYYCTCDVLEEKDGDEARGETVTFLLMNIRTVNLLAWVWTELSAKKKRLARWPYLWLAKTLTAMQCRCRSLLWKNKKQIIVMWIY